MQTAQRCNDLCRLLCCSPAHLDVAGLEVDRGATGRGGAAAAAQQRKGEGVNTNACVGDQLTLGVQHL